MYSVTQVQIGLFCGALSFNKQKEMILLDVIGKYQKSIPQLIENLIEKTEKLA